MSRIYQVKSCPIKTLHPVISSSHTTKTKIHLSTTPQKEYEILHLLPISLSLAHQKPILRHPKFIQAFRTDRKIEPNPFNLSLLLLSCLLGSGGWSSRSLGCSGLESVLEFTGNALQVTHTSSTGGLSSLSLLTPVVCSMNMLVYAPCEINHAWWLIVDRIESMQNCVCVNLDLETEKRNWIEERTLTDLSSWITA